MIRRLLAEGRRLARYGAVGASVTVFMYIVYLVLLKVGVSAVVAAGICYLPGVALSYVGNRRFTFGSEETHRRDLPRFLGAYGVGLVCTVSTVALLTIWLSAPIAQLINIVITPLVIYTSLRLLHFGEGEGQPIRHAA